MANESKNDKNILKNAAAEDVLNEAEIAKDDTETAAVPKENEELSPKAEKVAIDTDATDEDDSDENEDTYESAPETAKEAADKQGFADIAKSKLSAAVAWVRKDVRRMVGVGLLAVCVLVMLIAGSVGGGGAKTKGLSSELQALASERTELKVGVSATLYPPFVYEKYGGGYAGSDVDLMKAVCKEMGWRLTIMPINWADRQAVLADGEVDCLWCGFNSYGREDSFAWTEPYLNMSDVVAVPKKGSDIKELGDLEGKTVAAVANSNPARELEHIGLGLTRVSCQTIEECLEALNAKEVDAIAASAEDIDKISQSVTVLDDPLEARLYAVAFQKSNTDLRDIVDYAIAKACEGN